MRKILPKLLKDPVKRLGQLFPSAVSIKQFISGDLLGLVTPPGLGHPGTGHNTGDKRPYKFELPLPDINLLPDIVLDE